MPQAVTFTIAVTLHYQRHKNRWVKRSRWARRVPALNLTYSDFISNEKYARQIKVLRSEASPSLYLNDWEYAVWSGWEWTTNRIEEFVDLARVGDVSIRTIFAQTTGRDEYEFLLLERFGRKGIDILKCAWYNPDMLTAEVARYRKGDGEDVE